MEITPEPSESTLPDSLFDAWASPRNSVSRGLSEPTEAVQRAMWGAFGTWCIRNNIDVVNLTATELGRYIRSRKGDLAPVFRTP